MGGASLRLHGRVGEKRHHIVGLDPLHGARQTCHEIALGVADATWGLIKAGANKFANLLGRKTAIPAIVPGNAQRFRGILCGPP